MLSYKKIFKLKKEMDKLWNIETTRENKKVNYEKECYSGKY